LPAVSAFNVGALPDLSPYVLLLTLQDTREAEEQASAPVSYTVDRDRRRFPGKRDRGYQHVVERGEQGEGMKWGGRRTTTRWARGCSVSCVAPHALPLPLFYLALSHIHSEAKDSKVHGILSQGFFLIYISSRRALDALYAWYLPMMISFATVPRVTHFISSHILLQRAARELTKSDNSMRRDPQEMSRRPFVEPEEALSLDGLPDTVDRVGVEETTGSTVGEDLGRFCVEVKEGTVRRAR
jgi:hypothetical protein